MMEESAFCKGCNTWAGWFIFKDRIQCTNCGKTYTWTIDCTNNEVTRAQDIIHLVNDNY